jgi:hypothetical protein
MKATGSLMMILNGMQVKSRGYFDGGIAEGKGNKESDALLISKSLGDRTTSALVLQSKYWAQIRYLVRILDRVCFIV